MPKVDVGASAGVDLGDGPLGQRPVASWRASLDPDRFTGFGTWSGTSFAAPVMAGAAAQALLEHQTSAETAGRRPGGPRPWPARTTCCGRSTSHLPDQSGARAPGHSARR